MSQEAQMSKAILAIDGGGLRGVYAAAFLATLEKEMRTPIRDLFDLVAGTSTGGLIALAVGSGIAGDEIVDLYRQAASQIFSKPRLSLGGLLRPRFCENKLRAILEARFGDLRMEDIKTRVLVPSCEQQTGRVHVFKTPYLTHFSRDRRVRVVDVALATSAAPTYFAVHKGTDGAEFVDGGLWANNPSAAAVIEATSKLGWLAKDTRLVSIATTGSAFLTRPSPFAFLPFARLRRMLTFAFAVQGHASMGMADLILGSENCLRIEPNTACDAYDLDDPAALDALLPIGIEDAHRRLARIRAFLGGACADSRTSNRQAMRS